MFSSLDEVSVVVEFDVCVVVAYRLSGGIGIELSVGVSVDGVLGVAGNNPNSNPVPMVRDSNSGLHGRRVEGHYSPDGVKADEVAGDALGPACILARGIHGANPARGPYLGAYKGGLWNGQGFFHSDPHKYIKKKLI